MSEHWGTEGLFRWARGKEPACQCRRRERHGFNAVRDRSPGGGHGDPLLEHPHGLWSLGGLQFVESQRV